MKISRDILRAMPGHSLPLLRFVKGMEWDRLATAEHDGGSGHLRQVCARTAFVQGTSLAVSVALLVCARLNRSANDKHYGAWVQSAVLVCARLVQGKSSVASVAPLLCSKTSATEINTGDH